MTATDLDATLAELTDLLRSVGATWWADHVAQVAARVAAGADPSVASWMFGGSGSLTDLVIHPLNGHTVDRLRLGEVNDRLGELRSRVYAAAFPKRWMS
ncbi:MAG: hypothetical protein PGN24_08345 [Microbacterium arborescens]